MGNYGLFGCISKELEIFFPYKVKGIRNRFSIDRFTIDIRYLYEIRNIDILFIYKTKSF